MNRKRQITIALVVVLVCYSFLCKQHMHYITLTLIVFGGLVPGQLQAR